MMIHNRRKRRDYFATQKALHDAAVYEAQTAMRHGTASAEQLALVEDEKMERRVVEMREREKLQNSKDGVFGRTKAWLFDGLKREDTGAEMVGMDKGKEEEG